MIKDALKENLKKNKDSTEENDKDEKNKQRIKYSVSCLFPNIEVRDIAMNIAKRY